MKLEITPFKSLGPIEFGMSMEAVDRVLGTKGEVFQPFEEGYHARVSYFDTGIMAEFRHPSECVSVEASSPFEVIFRGRNLLEPTIAELQSWLSSLDANLEFVEGLVSRELGVFVVLTAASQRPNEPPLTAGCFEKNYHELADSEMEQFYLRKYEELVRTYGRDHEKTRDCALHLSSCYDVAGKGDLAAKWEAIWLGQAPPASPT